MYDVSLEYKEKIQGTVLRDKIEGIMTLSNGTIIALDESNISQGTLEIDNQCVNGEELEFGAVYAGQLSIDILLEEMDRYQLYDAKIELFWALALSEGWETIPLGEYYVTEAVHKGYYISVKALDGMIRLNEEYDRTSVRGSVYDLLVWACGKCDVALGMTKEEVEDFPNGTLEFTIDADTNCAQYRDIIAILAQLTATFATMGRDGTLKLVSMSQTETCYVPDYQRTLTEVADFSVEYMGLRFAPGAEAYNDKEEGLIMTIEAHPFMFVGTAEAKQAITDNILAKLSEYTYTPCTIEFSGNPAIECGDMVAFVDKGVNVYSIVTGYTWRFRGEHTIKSVGKNPRLLTVKNKDQKRYEGINKTITSTSYAMIAYTNVSDVVITPAFHEIAEFGFLTQQFVSAVLMLTVLVNFTEPASTVEDGEEEPEPVSEFTDVYFRVSVNGVYDNVFMPIQRVTLDSNHIISFSYPLSLTQEAVNSVRVYAKSDENIVIGINHIKAQIVGQGLMSTSAPWDGNVMSDDVFKPVSFGTSFELEITDGECSSVDTAMEEVALNLQEYITEWSFVSLDFSMGAFTDSMKVE